MLAWNRSIVVPYLLSGLFHAGLVTALVLSSVPADWNPAPTSVDTAVGPSTAAARVLPPVVTDEDGPVLPEAAGPSSVDALAEASATDPGLADLTRQRLQQAREQIATRSVAEQTEDLAVLAERLSTISSSASIDQLNETIAPWLGSDTERKTQPSDRPEDSEPLDVSTAQIFDVLKEQTEGSVQYVAVMVDAAGRTQETPLSVSDGESLYEVFELMKKFPLLESVYRKTVMGMLDRLLAEENPESRGASDNKPPSGDEPRSGNEPQPGHRDNRRQD